MNPSFSQLPTPSLLASNIRLARTQERYSIEDLARAVGVSPRSVYNWEQALTVPIGRNVRMVAEVLKRDVSWFAEDHSGELEAAA